MKNNRTASRKLVALLLAALLLLGVSPAFAEEEKEPFKGTVSFNINTRGFGISSTTLYFLNLSLGIDTEKKVADFNAGLFGKSVDLVFAWDNGKPRFSMPALGGEVYSFSTELVDELIKTGEQITESVKEQEALPGDDRQIGEKLTEGLTSLVSSAVTTDTEGTYTYRLTDAGTMSGRVFTMKLDKDQWGAFWQKLLSFGTEQGGLISSVAGKAGISADDLSSTLSDLAVQITELTADWELNVFYQGDALRAVSIGGASTGFIYESTGEAGNGGRKDLIGIREGEAILKLLENDFAKNANGFKGTLIADAFTVTYSFTKSAKGGFTFKIDFGWGDQGITVTATYKRGDVNITMPGESNTEIKDMNALGEVFSGLLEKSLSSLTMF